MLARPAGSASVNAPRRLGAPDAKNRAVLLDAAERLMREEWYAVVTSRRIVEQAGLKPQLVHCYFRAMDDLLLELFGRRAEQMLRHHRAALTSPQPLWAPWELNTDAGGTSLQMYQFAERWLTFLEGPRRLDPGWRHARRLLCGLLRGLLAIRGRRTRRVPVPLSVEFRSH